MPNNTIELIIKATDQASANIKAIAGTLDTLKTAFGGLVAGFTLDKLIDSITSAQTAANDLDRQFSQFGATVGLTEADMNDFADTTAKATTITSESLKEAQANLLNYTSITGASFEQARDLVVDLAAKMGGDAAQAAELLGRALQNPVSGIRLLAQVGVTLTQGQRATIASLVETGSSAQAAAFIMDQLRQRVTGAADALDNTLGGALKNLENSFASAFTGTGSDLEGLVSSIHDLSTEVQDPQFQAALQGIVSFIVSGASAIAEFASGIKELGEYAASLVVGSDTVEGQLQDKAIALQELIAQPDLDNAARDAYVAQLAVVQKQIDALGDSATSTTLQLQNMFGIKPGTDWNGNTIKSAPLSDPLQRQITLSPHSLETNAYNNPFIPTSLVDQYLTDTESDLDKAYDTLQQHIKERAELVQAGALDPVKAAAQNSFDTTTYTTQLDKELDYIQVTAKKMGAPLTDLEKEGLESAQTIQDAFANFFESGNLGARNFALTMVKAFEQIAAKAASIQLADALGLKALFGVSSDASGSSGGSTTDVFYKSALPDLIPAFAAGGSGYTDGPTVVGEEGPELLNPPGGSTVMNARQLAFAGNAGGGFNYAPVNHINVVADDTEKTTGALVQFLTAQQINQQKEFERKLARNGYKLR